MKRNTDLLEKREKFVVDYIKNSTGKQMKNIVSELTERLFLSERTIFNIYAGYIKKQKAKNKNGNR